MFYGGVFVSRRRGRTAGARWPNRSRKASFCALRPPYDSRVSSVVSTAVSPRLGWCRWPRKRFPVQEPFGFGEAHVLLFVVAGDGEGLEAGGEVEGGVDG